MSEKPKETSSKLHLRNRHTGQYDFDKLMLSNSSLEEHVFQNKYGTTTIDFANPDAVKALNSALLKLHYNLDFWDIPEGYLCPPVPGRADYIHYAADLIQSNQPKQIRCLDVGTGANCIYPIIGVEEYDWQFVATDIDNTALESAFEIVNNNENIRGKVEFRYQENPRFIFRNIIEPDEYFDLCICNPPFHSSAEEAKTSSLRKVKNLKGSKSNPILNFGGKNNELFYDGGEKAFLTNMAYESQHFAKNCGWFTSLVSKKDNIRPMKKLLQKLEVKEVKVIEMATGNKISRILAWKY
jgi:23S rRNA (adenine1618-N6)-methyltransferase